MRRDEDDGAVKGGYVGSSTGQQQAARLGVAQHVGPGGRPGSQQRLGDAAPRDRMLPGLLLLLLLLRCGRPGPAVLGSLGARETAV